MLPSSAARVRAFVPSVDYADFLRVTLPYNRSRLANIVVVTNHDDRETVAVAKSCGADVHQTDAWTRDGAYFNGARAIEEALDRFGRRGWVMQVSADIVLPESFASSQLSVGNLYSAPRRMLERWPTIIPDESCWAEFPYHAKSGNGLSGYLLLWHSDDPHLPAPPWQPVDWKHIGGSDSEFVARWRHDNQMMLPFDVLHLGLAGVDWCGRVQPFADGSKSATADERAATLKETLRRRRYLRRRGENPHGEEKIRLRSFTDARFKRRGGRAT